MKKILQLGLILLLSITGNVYAQDNLDCAKFKTGKFDTYVKGQVSTKIVRNSKYQREYSLKTGSKVKMKITWIDDCSYRLMFDKANKKFYELQGDKELHPEVIVTITEVNGLEYYHESRFTDIENYVYKGKVVKTK